MGAVVKLKERAPAPGFMDMVQSTAKPKTTAKAKKSSVPMLEATAEVKEAVDLYIEAKEREKIATAEKEASGVIITDFVRPIQDGDGFKGAFRNSYGVPGTKPGYKVTHVTQNKYSINAEDAPKIQEILGEENFGEMMDQTFSVVLKPGVFLDKELQADLMDMVGDRFTDFFDTVTSLKVKEGFIQRIYTAVPEDKLDDLRTFCKPYKPTLR